MPNFTAASRMVAAVGATYTGDPANLIDTDPATTADIYLTGAFQADWFYLDMGAEVDVASVTLTNVTQTANHIGVWVTDTPTSVPSSGDPGRLTEPASYPTGPGLTLTYTAPTGKTGRYVQIRQFELGAITGSVLIGGTSYEVYVPPPPSVPTPTLTGFAALVEGVPSILLQGH